MAKVIVERPRHGSRYDLRRPGRTCSLNVFNELPKRASMSRAFGHRTLNEHLAPLKRWLQSQVGRRWDAVYSELSEHLRPSDPVQQHVRDHVDDFVARHVVVVRGAPHHWRWGKLVPVGESRRTRLWVCPRTGLLREAPDRRPTVRPQATGPAPGVAYLQRGGCWFELTLALLPDDEPGTPAFDVALGRALRRISRGGWDPDGGERFELYGRFDVHTVSMRPLRRAELRRLGLHNASTRRDVRRGRHLTA